MPFSTASTVFCSASGKSVKKGSVFPFFSWRLSGHPSAQRAIQTRLFDFFPVFSLFRPLAAFCFSGLFSDAPFFSVWTRGRSCRRRASLPVYTSGDQATAFCGAGFSFLCLSSSFLLFLSPLSVDRVQAANACVRFFLAVV
ncbi:hypothetical protein TGDOM2_292325 [Toxoplasma gondii GAB2-2007-GAL-DOM2]|uniref:Transmembrane protein n=2 Tax=Toxoplasma gondii TaxID=5811 RepID=A0A425I484_TOXGO|nr:hypothetical protein TGDOM2_292325 [Toxoplasma gondii GAB2-2007-GAL-DOM2]RQX73531.1 hypothetical protein TGCAST_292325 [Toxoplasma gondii CAST]